MKLHVGVGLEPMFVFLVGVEVVEDDVKLSARKGRGDAVHEVEKLDAAPSFRMSRDDLSGGDFERRKQCCGAMPLVIVALAGQGAAIGQLQITLRSLQSLDRGLLVHAEYNRLRGRGDGEANNLGRFVPEVPGGAP